MKHFIGVEIPGFDLPNRFSGLTTSCFPRGGIGKLIFNKVKYLRVNSFAIIGNRTPGLWYAGLLTSKLPRQHEYSIQRWYKANF
jgi:hypothetical protein